jgi:hypothetical protein
MNLKHLHLGTFVRHFNYIIAIVAQIHNKDAIGLNIKADIMSFKKQNSVEMFGDVFKNNFVAKNPINKKIAVTQKISSKSLRPMSALNK